MTIHSQDWRDGWNEGFGSGHADMLDQIGDALGFAVEGQQTTLSDVVAAFRTAALGEALTAVERFHVGSCRWYYAERECTCGLNAALRTPTATERFAAGEREAAYPAEDAPLAVGDRVELVEGFCASLTGANRTGVIARIMQTVLPFMVALDGGGPFGFSEHELTRATPPPEPQPPTCATCGYTIQPCSEWDGPCSHGWHHIARGLAHRATPTPDEPVHSRDCGIWRLVPAVARCNCKPAVPAETGGE